MLTYSFYESDNRVRRYAETLVRRGDAVDVISLRREGQSDYGELNGVRIYRVQGRVRDERSKWEYLWRILKFFCRSAGMTTVKHLRRRYDLVHVHSVPDFEVFAALVPKLFGAKVILDIHDIVPELYANKFRVDPTSATFKALVLGEKMSIRFSDHVIISNDLWRSVLVSRSVDSKKCTAILNYPDDALFRAVEASANHARFVFLYPGTLNRHQGLDIAVNAFALIKDAAPDADFHIYGDGPAKSEILDLVRAHGLEGRVLVRQPVPLDEIVDIMARADVGVIPKRNDSFGGDAFSTKSLEFMMLGVPIIVSRTRVDQLYFNDAVVRFCEPGDVADLAEAMLALIENTALREKLSSAGRTFANKNRWELKQGLYLDLVDELCGTRP
jgi:glycosyltransferase involved in cell wall biosynthesis